jgi:hypothetical protein
MRSGFAGNVLHVFLTREAQQRPDLTFDMAALSGSEEMVN